MTAGGYLGGVGVERIEEGGGSVGGQTMRVDQENGKDAEREATC